MRSIEEVFRSYVRIIGVGGIAGAGIAGDGPGDIRRTATSSGDVNISLRMNRFGFTSSWTPPGAEPGRIADMEQAILEVVVRREQRITLGRSEHQVFLDAEIGNPGIEMGLGRHRDR